MHTIVEVGCGNGYYLQLLNSYYKHANYYGYDQSQELIKLANKSPNDIQFSIGSFESCHNADLLILRLIMHQIEDRKTALATIVDSLSDKSKILIIDSYDEFFFLTPDLPNFSAHLSNHRKFFSPKTANRNVTDYIELEMQEHKYELFKKNYYYVPSNISGYKKKYFDYMLSTAKMIGANKETYDEIETWLNDSKAFAQIGLFMYCFTKMGRNI